MTNISLLIPTRERPHHINRIIEELKEVLGEGLEMVLGIDEDDETYSTEHLGKIDGIKIVRTPSTKYLSNLYNILFEYSSGNIIGYFADDIEFKDLSVFADVVCRFEKEGNILYDFGGPWPCHAFVTRKSIRALGFLHIPNLEHGYSDHYIGNLYRSISRCYSEESKKLFDHPSGRAEWRQTGKGEIDNVYFEKSVAVDNEGKTADERDQIKFDDFKNKYLYVHQTIISSL